MQEKINFKNIITVPLIHFILVLITIPSMIRGEDKFLLNELEMDNFKLVKISSNGWIIDRNGTTKEAVRQKWQDNNNNNFYIEYCSFNNIGEAITATITAANDNASPYIWGTPNGTILGDVSWIDSEKRSVYFIRGNIGIKIYQPTGLKDSQALISVSSTLIKKIQSINRSCLFSSSMLR